MSTENVQFLYNSQEEYYKSLRPSKVPSAWFAGDLMHYLFVESYAIGKKVLDVGCGLGYGSYHLALKGADKITAIDISNKSLFIAKRTYTHPNLEFLLMNATSMSFADKMFDLVVSFEVLEHLPSSMTDSYMNEITRVLNQDGKFIISTPNRDVYSLGSKTSKTFDHINELSAQEFVQLMQRYFKKCDFFYQMKYDKQELESKKDQYVRILNKPEQLSWKSIVPKPIRKTIRRVIASNRLKLKNSRLIEYMKLYAVKHAETIADLELSVVQIAICEEPVIKS
jgi:ubiquinone/menaquinone biosynthesis C-methylase UbiE